MKSLKDMLNESLVNEASKYQPTFKPADWSKALKELNKGAAGNYTQLRGMENLVDDVDMEVSEWIDELYDGTFDKKETYKDILIEIATFFKSYYSTSSYDYADGAYDIYNAKQDMSPCDFGVEAENWYMLYEYIGPSKLKAYASKLADVGDCSYMDDMDEFEEDW
jgi:hypothetical protein